MCTSGTGDKGSYEHVLCCQQIVFHRLPLYVFLGRLDEQHVSYVG